MEISKDTVFYRSDHFANWESFNPPSNLLLPVSTTFFARFDAVQSLHETGQQVSFQEWIPCLSKFQFPSHTIRRIFRHTFIELHEIRSITFYSRRDEFKEGNNGRGRNGRERSVPGNKKSFTFFHFLPLRIKGEKKGRWRQKRNIVGKWKGVETLHALLVSSEAE